MKTLRLGRHDVVIYDSTDELPVLRFHRFVRLLFIDAGVGSTMAEFDTHIERVVRYLKNDDREKAVTELENLRQCVSMIQNEMPLTGMAFASLVASIDGHAADDVSDEGLRATLVKIGDVAVKDLSEALAAAKKKIEQELVLYFPKVFDSAKTREQYDILKRRTELLLQEIIDGDDEERRRKIEDLTNALLVAEPPSPFYGRNSAEIVQDKNFESLCLSISREFNVDAKRMTVVEFYTAQESLLELAKNQKKKWNKTR